MKSSRRNSQLSLGPMAVTTVDRKPDHRSTSVDQARDLLRRAVADCGYTLDALEAAMGKGRAYIHKVLQGEKPLSYDFVIALPDDVEARFEQLRAESFGHIVVTPAPDAKTAAEHLVSGVLGLLATTAKKAGAA